MNTNRRPRILVVDDEEMLRSAIEQILTRAGYEVLTAEGGREAYDIICREQIDAVISDVRMPTGSGIELLLRAKQRNPAIPIIIFITAFSDLTKAQAFNLGAAGILSKPFRKDDLLNQLKVATGLWPKQNYLISPVELNGLLSVEQLGRGGFSFHQVGLKRVPIDVVCSFNLQGPGFVLKGTGVIRWSEDSGDGSRNLGVEFMDLDDHSKIKFSEWLAENNPIPHIPHQKHR